MLVPIFVIGLISSIVTEILKFFPWLSETDNRKRALSFVISIILSLIYVFTTPDLAGREAFVLLFGGVGAAFLVYKSVVQTFTDPIRSKLEKQVRSEEPKA